MKTKLYSLISIFFIIPFITLSQVQIGQDIDGEAIDDWSGRIVSLSSDGNIVAICATGNDDNGTNSGHIRVYENVAGVWTQIGSDIDGEAEGDASGHSVSLSSGGSIVAIGAPWNAGNNAPDSSTGHVRVYENVSGVWTQIGQDIDGEAILDFSGWSVSLSSDGTIIAIGAIGNNSGYVRVYENISGVWTQIGQDIDGEADNDWFGASVSLSSDGTIVAIAGPKNDDNGNRAGHVRVYENVSGVWMQIGQDIDGEAENDGFDGYSVSLSSDGSIVAIGAPYNSGNGIQSGHVRVYENVSGVWTQIGQDIDGLAPFYEFGWSVSLSSDGSIIAISAPGNDDNGNMSGKVYIYKNISGVWMQIGQDVDGESGDYLGFSVSLSTDGSVVAISAPGSDNNGEDSGHVKVFDLSSLLSTQDFSELNINLYPNPTKNMLNIEATNTIETIEVFNLLGQQILSSKPNTITEEIDMKGLNSGMYLVTITIGEQTATYKVIKE